jgi:hypothetical protein
MLAVRLGLDAIDCEYIGVKLSTIRFSAVQLVEKWVAACRDGVVR